MTNEQTIDGIMALASEVEDQGLIHTCGEGAEPIAERDALRHAITAALAAKDAEIEVLARWKSTNAPRLDALAGLLDAARANEVKGAEAIASLDSERAANAILTEEIERLKARLADSGCDLHALKASPAPGEWIEWAGGKQPVPDGVLCKTRLEAGDEGARLAENWVWDHDEFGANIVAYRVLP
ncbi:MAG: hypothetical protein RJA63_24 [Pseudomonadota bacterium]|jgi:hypothetical protein